MNYIVQHRRFTSAAISLVCLMFITFNISAQQTEGSSSGSGFRKVAAVGGQVLKMGYGARAIGMAGAFGGVSNDLSALFYNPGGLADIDGYNANLSYANWFGGFTHNFVGASAPLGGSYRIAVNAVNFSSGDIPLTTLEGNNNTIISTYSISDFSLATTISGYLTEQFSFGVTAKYLQHSIAGLSAGGLVCDVGTMYRFGGVRLGFAIQNFGAQQSYSGEELRRRLSAIQGLPTSVTDFELPTTPFNLPLIFRAGIACDLMSEVFNMYESKPDFGVNEKREHRLLLAGDFETFADIPEQYSIGTEYTWNDLLSLRAGYRFNNDQFGLSGGVGVKYIGGGFDGMFDYAIQPTKDLGVINRISVSLKLQ